MVTPPAARKALRGPSFPGLRRAPGTGSGGVTPRTLSTALPATDLVTSPRGFIAQRGAAKQARETMSNGEQA